MIRAVEIIVLILLAFFALFMGVKYSGQIKSSDFWVFGDDEKLKQEEVVISPVQIEPVIPVAVENEAETENYLKEGGILQEVMINDLTLEKIIFEVERQQIETPN